jgi:NAD(P)-dependent dehydrogenase (short-subunit alcohol dehydrogenase family)
MTALVTGAAGGIGKAIVSKLRSEGFDVKELDLVSGFDVDPFGPKAKSINGHRHGVVTWGHLGHRLQRAFQRGTERPRLW